MNCTSLNEASPQTVGLHQMPALAKVAPDGGQRHRDDAVGGGGRKRSTVVVAVVVLLLRAAGGHGPGHGGGGGRGRRLDDMPAEGLSGQICPSPIVILLKGVQTPLS